MTACETMAYFRLSKPIRFETKCASGTCTASEEHTQQGPFPQLKVRTCCETDLCNLNITTPTPTIPTPTTSTPTLKINVTTPAAPSNGTTTTPSGLSQNDTFTRNTTLGPSQNTLNITTPTPTIPTPTTLTPTLKINVTTPAAPSNGTTTMPSGLSQNDTFTCNTTLGPSQTTLPTCKGHALAMPRAICFFILSLVFCLF